MARLSATIGISGCTTTRNEHETQFPEPKAFSAFESVFRPVVDSPPHRSEAEGRPKKRRKTHNGDQAGGGQLYDPEKSALLAKITLDLVPSKFQTLPALEDDARASVVLHLASVQKEQDQLTLSLVEPVSLTTLQVSAKADSTVLEPLATHLITAALVGAEPDESSSVSRRDYIPFSRCVLLAPTSDRPSIQFDIELRWPFGVSLSDVARARFSQRANSNILSTYFAFAATEDRTPWTLADFYDAVHVPPLDSDISPRIESSLPSTHLYPYQQRSVDWMLRREGTTFSSTGEIQEIPRRTANTVPVSFFATTDSQGRKCYVSHVRGMLIPDMSQEWDSTALPGGILAEEMGLGKSVELISLMCLNKRDITKEDVYDPYLAKTVKASGATLIITPPAILGQWITEVNKHAPQLKCFHYRGFSQHTQEEAAVEHLLQFDVVLTSYDVLSKEIHRATPPPERSLRRVKVHERRISPLVDISWWRVCLDEAQMLEKGVSQAATMARIIPRCNAWAVSGTPLRTNITDLIGLLIFLRCEPFASVKDHFARLDRTSFRDLINRIALRHTKDQIRGDLDIPPQRRVVITVPFTAIEAEYYKDMYRQMYEACFLSPEGVPLREDRGIDHPETIERMREWLVRLRQTCLHSHVGEKNRKALGPKRQPLRTVQEVLQVMIDQNETKLKSEVREMILAQMKRGHICSFAFNFPKEQAILYYQEALKTTLEYVKLGREEIQTEVARLRQNDPSSSDHGESDDEDEKDETSAKFARMVTLRRSLRSFLELEHACYFFIGNMYFQWKENIALTVPDSAEYEQREKSEKEWYDKAQLVRQELLKDTEKRTQRQMQKVRNMKARYQDLELPEIEDLGGIESSNVIEKLDVITNIINEQSVKLKEWRNKIIETSTTSLVDNAEDKDTTGEEYETSLKIQDELYVYIQALRTIVADMNTAVQGTQDTLVNHEMEQAVRQAGGEDVTKRGHAPELLLRLANERAPLRAKPQHGSLKGVVGSARQLVASLQHRAEVGDRRAVVELAIAQKYLAQIQDMFSARTELLADLEKEQEQFRLTMNMRLEFYRQIQHISDSVEDYQEEMDEVFDHDAFQLQSIQIEARKINIQRFKVKQTYLNNLRGGAEEPKAECKICMDEYERGILTACGHRYCRDCIFTWWRTTHNHNCPECRTALTRADLKDIVNITTITAQEEAAPSTEAPSPLSSSPSTPSIYSTIHTSTMNEIKTIDLPDSYGSKINMLARHLLYLRNNDPASKSIIYSQFTDFLSVLQHALRRFKIPTSSIREKGGIEMFKEDPSIEAFLLDAKSNSSGLNLVNATYVFLCEPLINPALELQAIARVHRIGQKRGTTVFMYIVGGTVEEAIYDISVRRRMEHLGRERVDGSSAGETEESAVASSREENATSGAATADVTERVLDVLNSEEIKSAALNKLVREGNQGEVVGKEDLWGCLFGRVGAAQSETRSGAGVQDGTEAPHEAVVEAADAAVNGALATEAMPGVEGLDGVPGGSQGRMRHEMRVRREGFLQMVEAGPRDAGGEHAVE